MTEAQVEALNLLKLFDRICSEKNIIYTLGDVSIINYEYRLSDEYFEPNNLTVCLLFRDYLTLLNHLKRYAAEYNIDVLDYTSKDNFDSLSAWLMYRGKNLLPNDRREDECYYRTRIIITPILYAGNTLKECKKTCHNIEHFFTYLDARMPLQHKRVFSSIKGHIDRIKQWYYCAKKKRQAYSIDALINKLNQSANQVNYFVYQNEDNSTAWMKAEEFDVERVQFYGIDTCVIKDREGFIYRNYKKRLNDGFRKISELLLRGGRDLRRIQLIQLDMLKEIDCICRKHNLKYNIAFGTLLGAVRHGGFIPWDDDADINMPYEDYLKLIDVIEDELDHDKYYFRFQDKEDDCNITYAHLKRNGTVYTKRGRDGFKYHPGVYIDIVPLFNGAPNLLLHKIQTRVCWTLRTACWAYIGAESEKNAWKRAYYKLLAKLGNKRAYRLFIKAATFFKHKSNKMLFLNGLDRSPYNIGFVKRECFDDPVEIEFEGYKFFAPKDTQGVLEYCYGKDYMQYLPLYKRKPKNDALIELGNLYSDI